MNKIAMKSGDEYDVLTRARKMYLYTKRAGVCKSVKRRYNRRFRQVEKTETKKELD